MAKRGKNVCRQLKTVRKSGEVSHLVRQTGREKKEGREEGGKTRRLLTENGLLFAKSSPFSVKSRLVFPPSSRPSFFSLPVCRTRWDTSPLFRTVFNCRHTFFPLLAITYRREQLTFLALSICCTKQNSSNSSEDELLLFEFRNI